MPLIVNGETIDDALIREEARQMRPHYQQMVQDMDPIEAEMQLRDWSRENVIERTLLRQEAMKGPEPIPGDELEAALRAQTQPSGGQSACRTEVDAHKLRIKMEAALRVDRLLQKVTGKLSPPRNKEISQYYRKHRDELWTAEQVGTRHIVKNVDENTSEQAAREAIEEVERRLKAGEDFSQLADSLSDCPGNGGDLGYFPRGEMVAEFDEVVFGMEPGTTSAIFRTTFGFHIARVYGRKPEGIPRLEEVRDQIAALLLKQKKDRALERYLDRLRAKADIRNTKDDATVGASGE